jgi:hypothetical protein
VAKGDKIFRVKGDNEIITVAPGVSPAVSDGLERNSAAFPESLDDAVVDHDSDHAHSHGDDHHADQDGPDPSKANGANHERDLNGSVVVPSISRLR